MGCVPTADMDLEYFAPYSNNFTSKSEINSKFLKMYSRDGGASDKSATSYFKKRGYPLDNILALNIIKNAIKKSPGVFIDNNLHDDFIHYDGLDLDDDFAIEMRVKIPTDNSLHYLIHSGNDIKLFIENGKLYFNKKDDFTGLNLSSVKGTFQTISLVRDDNKIYVSKGNYSDMNRDYTNQDISSNITFIYVGGAKGSTNYKFQLNEIIDYLKIYQDES